MIRKTYPKYKNSGAEWLGDVPMHWEVKRLKYRSSINDETLPETNDPEYELLYVDISSVDPVQGIIKKEPMIFENAPSRARRIVKNGDTIVSTVRTYLRAISPIKNPEPNLIVSTGFAVVRPDGLEPDYLSSVIRALYFIEEIVSRSVGVSYPAINASEIGLISIPIPPLPEQQAIAAFLDREMIRIDSLIGKKQKLVEFLKEKRTALISESVTKGLDASVKMKPSGVEWLGEVPEHWEVKRLKNAFYISNGSTPDSSKDEYWDGEIVWYTPEDLGNIFSKYISDSRRKISKAGYTNTGSTKVPPQSIIISTRAPIGHIAITSIHSITNQGCRSLVPKKNISSDYYYYYLLVSKKNLNAIGKGTTFVELGNQGLSSYPIPFPLLLEQQAIAAFLDHEVLKIDTLVSKVETVIEKLKEYRVALISAAVTGKIDVREENE